ncbi:MAG: hypothetical protein LBT48_07705 [Prevotellaceae bacterium]|jgi:C-terminal processing protease CtpA/Prc|nr:hypothetical protein [Prevotellaceae bacterium]
MKKIFITGIALWMTVLICFGNTPNDKTQSLTKQEKVYALSVLWKELHYNFAFPERLQQVNIDSLYLAYIPKIEQAENYDYYRTLQAFLSHFNDGHTTLFDHLGRDFSQYDVPKLSVQVFGEKIIIENMAESMADKLPIGSEITHIQHIPVAEYMRDSIFPYIAAAPNNKLSFGAWVVLFGKPNSLLHITVKTIEGTQSEAQLIRNIWATEEEKREKWAHPFNSNSNDYLPINIEIKQENIGYIQLNTFAPASVIDTINAVFDQMLPQLRQCKGLIIDIRNNGGGSERAWFNIVHHLVLTDTFTEGVSFAREHSAERKAKGQACDSILMKLIGATFHDTPYVDYYKGTVMNETFSYSFSNPVPDSLKLRQPLVILSGSGVASAAEGFLLVMKEAKRGIIMGEPSKNSFGQPLFIQLPGDVVAMINASHIKSVDGTDFSQTGIPPDITVPMDVKAYLEGRDNVLERAIEELQKMIKQKK